MVFGIDLYLRSLKSGAIPDKGYRVIGVGLGNSSVQFGVTRNLCLGTSDGSVSAVSLYMSVIHIHYHFDGHRKSSDDSNMSAKVQQNFK